MSPITYEYPRTLSPVQCVKRLPGCVLVSAKPQQVRACSKITSHSEWGDIGTPDHRNGSKGKVPWNILDPEETDTEIVLDMSYKTTLKETG